MMSMIIFHVFLAAEPEYDIRFASSRLDWAVPELWIFVFLLKNEKNSERKGSTTITWDVFLCIFGQGIRKKH